MTLPTNFLTFLSTPYCIILIHSQVNSTILHGKLILASLNVQSLMSKHSALKNYLLELSSSPLHILAIQETWSIPHPHLVSIPGFNFIHSERKVGRGGGVGFYVKEDLIFSHLPNYSLFIPKIFECLTIEVSLDNKRSTFTSIYRSPSDHSENLNECVSHLDHLMFELSSKYENSFICLDSNVNSLIHPTNPHHAKYFSSICENGFIQCISKATRISGSSSSLIDHILSNSLMDEVTSGTIISDISDHFMTFVQLPSRPPRASPKIVESRLFTKPNIERFKACLGSMSWKNVTDSNDVNLCYNLFWTDFNMLFIQNFPVKRARFNKNLHKICNYMTQGLLVSRQTKLKLHKISIHTPSPVNIQSYKNFRNLYNKILRASKKFVKRVSNAFGIMDNRTVNT